MAEVATGDWAKALAQAQDSRKLARLMRDAGVEALLICGTDGKIVKSVTDRDLNSGIGTDGRRKMSVTKAPTEPNVQRSPLPAQRTDSPPLPVRSGS